MGILISLEELRLGLVQMEYILYARKFRIDLYTFVSKRKRDMRGNGSGMGALLKLKLDMRASHII